MALGALFSHPECRLHHNDAGHPECAARVQEVDDQIIAARLEASWSPMSAPLASRDALERVHAPDYLRQLEEMALAHADDSAVTPLDGDPDTFVSKGSWQAALRAAGAAVAAVDVVLDGQFDTAFCNVRPPGHHASQAVGQGFCLINNVAVAVMHALEARQLSRVAIIDFDVHHGNGTEAIFAGDPRVLMCGFFQHPYYPHSGVPPAGANMLNAPLPAGAGGDAVRALVETEWLPRLHAFKPELVVFSAGFDGHRDDDMGGMALVEADFAWITTQLRNVASVHAQGRMVSCLEGGYALSPLARSVVAHLRAMTDV